MFRFDLVGLLALAAFAAPVPGQAQYLTPPGDIRGGAREMYQPAQGADVAGQMVRIDRLENQVRGLTGQIEQLQFANKRLEDQLRKFQQDVEFRLQENNGRAAPGGARPPAPQTPPAPGRRTERTEDGAPPLSQAPATRLARRGDAFDPDANPAAPGAPRQLGAQQQPLRGSQPPPGATPAEEDDDYTDLNAPVDLTRPNPRLPPPGPVTGGIPQVQPLPPSPSPQTAALPPATPQEEFDRATATLRGGQYEAAENAYRAFIQKFPKSALVPSATFNLGESFFRRQRPREAAEQYLKVYTDYPKSPRAPDALIKLGLALEKLGAKEQACAAWNDVGVKYSTANASVRASAERESQRAKC